MAYTFISVCIKDNKTVIGSPNTDYACRMVVPRSILATFMAAMVMNLDYANFKATIPCNDEPMNEAYFKCWEVVNE